MNRDADLTGGYPAKLALAKAELFILHSLLSPHIELSVEQVGRR